jgi:hypothetical protein
MLHLRLIILSVGGDVRVDSETLLITDFINLKIKPAQSLLLVTDFVNLKIKPTQSFKDAYISRMCVRVFIGVNTHTRMNIYISTVFLKKIAFDLQTPMHVDHGLLRAYPTFSSLYAQPA